ncbi:VanZ family protein [Desulfomicrobium sp. ZS1]|jgi:VanZ family protein|uniref:VanZ family protein n=1 Tax=Desulfomicrobium sp. ZS1 TaxID=2952228 RepID=UPI0020B32032|nr:VanZ family protein [Desulfomicrobium sp. ZS1]UTF50453.1 VanZ family protein [Desulfomicrobium sp. ZS1]
MRENTVISLHKLTWAAYVLALIVGSLVPVDMSGAPEQSDKAFHFLAYGLMVFFWPADWKGFRLSPFWLAAGLGLLLEIAQGALPTGRFMDLWDVAANALGAGVGLAVALLRFKHAGRSA